MAQDTSQNDLSFIEKKDANSLTFKDIFFTVLRNLHWLLIFAAIGGVAGWYYADRSNRIYESHAKIKIYETTENTMTAQLERVVQRRNRAASKFLNDEITILTSETAMLETARRLNLNTSYFCETRIVKRMKDLYKNSPIEAELPDLNERDYASFYVTVSRDSVCTISIDGEEPVTGHLSDTVSTRIGRVCIKPTWAFREEYHDTPVKVVRQNIYDIAAYYRGSVSATRSTDSDGIINMALTDRSAERAADILNMMITVYNENAIEERKSVIMQTSEFINRRVAQLDAELGSQEAKIASFKKEHQLLNVEEFGQTYMAASKASAEESERLRDQISHARYLQSLTDANAENKLFPVTIDIDDDNIRQTISDFNKLVLKLDKYKETGTTNNPVVQNMQLELTSLKSNLNQLIESYIGALEQKIVSVEVAGAKARAKISSVPTGQQYVDNIARVQGIKEAGEVELEDGRKAYELRKLDLFEVSLVQIPANQHATNLFVCILLIF